MLIILTYMTAKLDRKETYLVWDTEDMSLEEHTGDEILWCIKNGITFKNYREDVNMVVMMESLQGLYDKHLLKRRLLVSYISGIKPIMLIWYYGNVYAYPVLPNTQTDYNRSALESNFFPVIYNGELRVLDLWLSDCLDAKISAKMDLKTFTRRILIDEKSLLR